jgi:two-component system, NtrC family, sensor histidine kinase KinB
MFGLRPKLLLGFGGLLTILLIVSGLGIALSIQQRQALNKFLYENWRSVDYGQTMIDSLARLDEIARQPNLNGQQTTARQTIDQFQKSLNDENRNITLPGEQQLADRLSQLWQGGADSYQQEYSQLLAANSSPEQRSAAVAEINRLSPQVKSAAQAIIHLNLANMIPTEGRIKAMSDRTIRLLFLLAAAGVLLAIIFTVVMGRSILQPVQALTRSAHEIEQGNLDLVVQVRSHDELRQLAEAFNSMTAKLREYRRTNRAKLVRTQQTTQLAINSLPDAVAIVSPEGTIEMANTAAQKLFALRPDAQVNDLRIGWLGDLYRRTTKDLQAVEPRGYESAIQVLDERGGERFFLPHAVPILDEDHQLLGVTIVLADVTHLRRLDEIKSSMLSVVSHELKTPLTSIRMGVHLLLEERIGSLTPQQTELMLAVREDSDRLNQIVENLLDMGRIESGRALMDLQPERPERLIAKAVERMSSAFQDRGIDLISDISQDLPAVLADAPRIELVFVNLLNNALRFTPAGGHVRVSAAGDKDAVQFTVEDTGPGIPAQYQDRIFERFFRAPGQSKGSGAGLGLAIAKEILAAHDGSIRVESSEGHGSKFTFTLPLADAASLINHETNQEALTPMNT